MTPFQERGERPRLRLAFTVDLIVVDHRRLRRLLRSRGAEIPGDGDKLVEVVQPRPVLRIARRLQLGSIPGAVDDRFDEFTDVAGLRRCVDDDLVGVLAGPERCQELRRSPSIRSTNPLIWLTRACSAAEPFPVASTSA